MAPSVRPPLARAAFIAPRRVAFRHKFDLRIPTASRRVVCCPGTSAADCVGGMFMVRRNGRWEATKVELSCKT